MKNICKFLSILTLLTVLLPSSALAYFATLNYTLVDTTSSSFVIPAIGSTVSVSTTLINTFPINTVIAITDGTHSIVGYVQSAITNASSFTFSETNISQGAAGNTMATSANVSFPAISPPIVLNTNSIPTNPVVPGLSASSPVCTNGLGVLVTTGCSGGGGSVTFSYGGTVTSPWIVENYYISNVPASTQTSSQTFTPSFSSNPLCSVSTISGTFVPPAFIFTNISTTTYQIYNSNSTNTLSAEVTCIGP